MIRGTGALYGFCTQRFLAPLIIFSNNLDIE